MDNEHEMKILVNAVSVEGTCIECKCGWISLVSDEKFIQPIWDRHLRINNVSSGEK